MKQALLIVLLILVINTYGQQRNNSGVETYPGMQKNGAYAVHKPEADAKKVEEENKASANVTRICDTFIPPLCLLLILWLGLSLPGREEGKTFKQ